MSSRLCLALVSLGLVGATGPLDAPPLDPPAAIALADRSDPGEAVGQFRLTVAGLVEGRQIVFFNSKADYRSPGNLTFMVLKPVAMELLLHSGLTDMQDLVGKTIIASGRVEKRPIVNLGADGQASGFSHWGYSVQITKAEQIVSINSD